jgi:hypothetical protein
MNPIPLSAPDGRIYSYACSECHRVPAHGHIGGDHDGPSAQIIQSVCARAARCCTCRTCEAPRPRGIAGFGWQCAPCTWRSDWIAFWRDLAREITGPSPDDHPSSLCKCACGEHGDKHDDGCKWAEAMCKTCKGNGHCPTCHGEGTQP